MYIFEITILFLLNYNREELKFKVLKNFCFGGNEGKKKKNKLNQNLWIKNLT